MLETLMDLYDQARLWLFEGVVQPLVYGLGGASYLNDAFDATGWLLVGLMQIAVMLLLIGPLQRWRPAQPISSRAAVRVDVIYTLIQRLGLFRVALFFSLDHGWNQLWGWLTVQGLPSWQLDAALAPLWPGVSDTALASFLIYLVAFDLVNYLIHRGQHQFDWWWALHALHHSQRDLTMWSDNRNHLLDDLIRDIVFVLVGRAIGVPPGQFVAVVAIGQLVENLSHANVRLHFGWLGERLLVGPRYHRLHHGAGIGHESAGQGTLGGHNFSVLLPLWDMLAGTACFEDRRDQPGVRDQIEQGRDYGEGFWRQQWLGLLRLTGRA